MHFLAVRCCCVLSRAGVVTNNQSINQSITNQWICGYQAPIPPRYTAFLYTRQSSPSRPLLMKPLGLLLPRERATTPPLWCPPLPAHRRGGTALTVRLGTTVPQTNQSKLFITTPFCSARTSWISHSEDCMRWMKSYPSVIRIGRQKNFETMFSKHLNLVSIFSKNRNIVIFCDFFSNFAGK